MCCRCAAWCSSASLGVVEPGDDSTVRGSGSATLARPSVALSRERRSSSRALRWSPSASSGVGASTAREIGISTPTLRSLTLARGGVALRERDRRRCCRCERSASSGVVAPAAGKDSAVTALGSESLGSSKERDRLRRREARCALTASSADRLAGGETSMCGAGSVRGRSSSLSRSRAAAALAALWLSSASSGVSYPGEASAAARSSGRGCVLCAEREPCSPAAAWAQLTHRRFAAACLS